VADQGAPGLAGGRVPQLHRRPAGGDEQPPVMVAVADMATDALPAANEDVERGARLRPETRG